MSVTRRRLKTATSRLRDDAHRRVDEVADSLDSLQGKATAYVGKATDFMERGRERASELADIVEERIRRRPLATIAAGTAIGFLLGCLIARR